MGSPEIMGLFERPPVYGRTTVDGLDPILAWPDRFAGEPDCTRPGPLAAQFPVPCRSPAMTHLEFELDRDHVELNQLLKLSGVCDSGGAGKALVASGRVRVDGAVELRKTRKVHAGSTVNFEDVEIRVLSAVG
jgi:ribosome-associated protein